MGKRFIPFHWEHFAQLDNYHPAELMYEYFVDCQKNPYVHKDQDGYFSCSANDIQDKLGYGRAIQSKARGILVHKGWLGCRMASGEMQSYRVLR